MITYKKLLLIELATLITGCAHEPINETLELPDTETAFLYSIQYKGPKFNINKKDFFLIFIDGEMTSHTNTDGIKLSPGKHTIGVEVTLRNVLIPIPKSCISAFTLSLEAGRRYGYDIEKNQNEIFLQVIDDTGRLVSIAPCEPCSLGMCGSEQVNSIMERVQRESNN